MVCIERNIIDCGCVYAHTALSNKSNVVFTFANMFGSCKRMSDTANDYNLKTQIGRVIERNRIPKCKNMWGHATARWAGHQRTNRHQSVSPTLLSHIENHKSAVHLCPVTNFRASTHGSWSSTIRWAISRTYNFHLLCAADVRLLVCARMQHFILICSVLLELIDPVSDSCFVLRHCVSSLRYWYCFGVHLFSMADPENQPWPQTTTRIYAYQTDHNCLFTIFVVTMVKTFMQKSRSLGALRVLPIRLHCFHHIVGSWNIFCWPQKKLYFDRTCSMAIGDVLCNMSYDREAWSWAMDQVLFPWNMNCGHKACLMIIEYCLCHWTCSMGIQHAL